MRDVPLIAKEQTSKRLSPRKTSMGKRSSGNTGFSLVELIVTVAVFMIIVSGVGFLVLDTYIFNQDAGERTRAVFIAEEWQEAVRSIRDNNWGDIPTTDGDYCIILSGGVWIFDPSPPPCAQIDKFNPRLTIASDSGDPANKKQITSHVSWDFRKGETRDIRLVSFFTNWQVAGAPSFISQLHYRWRNDDGGE